VCSCSRTEVIIVGLCVFYQTFFNCLKRFRVPLRCAFYFVLFVHATQTLNELSSRECEHRISTHHMLRLILVSVQRSRVHVSVPLSYKSNSVFGENWPFIVIPTPVYWCIGTWSVCCPVSFFGDTRMLFGATCNGRRATWTHQQYRNYRHPRRY